MRRMSRARAVTIVLGLALWAALGAAGPAAAATGSISGKVVDATTKTGIQQIWVCTHSASMLGPFGGCAFTDLNGEYTIPALEPSSYVVVFNEEGRQGHLAQYYDGKATREEAEVVTVGDGQSVTDIDAELGESGKIAGNVTDVDTGQPIGGVQACAPEAGGFKDGAVTHCDKTDVNGDYLIEGLATGSYKVEFRVEEEPNYIAQYYNGKASWSEAEPVAVVAPITTNGIDAAMKEGVQITGQLTEAGSGSPVKWVAACALQAGTEEVKGCAPSREDGTYSIAGLPPGSYVVSFAVDIEEDGVVLHPDGFVRQYYNVKPTFAAADRLTSPGPAKFTGINAQLVMGPEIFPNRRPATPPPVLVTLIEQPAPKPLRCKKSFRKKFVKGKQRCIKVHKKHRRHSHKHGPHAVATGR
jgi:hypothetical protein